MSAVAAMRITFGQWLKLRRGIAGLSQQAMADAIGVTRQTVSNWERDRADVDPSFAAAQKMAAVFGVSLEVVAKGVRGEIEVDN